jgi:hypothetical protein
MTLEAAPELRSDRAQVRRFNNDAWPRDPFEEPRTRYWRAAGRITLLALLAFAGIQYYYFDVYLTIMALPRLEVLVAAAS